MSVDDPADVISLETIATGVPGPNVWTPTLQERSCIECSRRKVRCDRLLPCSNCTRNGVECRFPRYRKRPTPRKARARQLATANSFDGSQAVLPLCPTTNPTAPSVNDDSCSRDRDGDATQPIRVEEPHWLVRDQRQSRYIGNSFWASMSRNVAEMRDVLDESSSDQQSDQGGMSEDEAPVSNVGESHGVDSDAFVFRPMSTASAPLRPLYPTSSQLLTLLDIYYDNVDPVAKIFHRDALKSVIHDPLSRSHDLSKAGEAVLFSVYYAAVTSLSGDDCKRLLGEESQVLLQRYRYAVEQALARAQFLQSQNFNVLSSLVLFLLCARRHDTSRFVSGLLGVAIRTAQGMGLHRDGSQFQLTYFQTEMRRRLWWHISVLDLRCSEDHGVDPGILDNAHDTLFPSNLNDDQLFANQDGDAPSEQTGLSDMTFCLVRFEVCVAIRKLHYRNIISSTSVVNKQEIVEHYEKRFHELYIDPCDVTKPVHWVSATWAKMMLAKMWLTVAAPMQVETTDNQESINDGTRRLAFEKALEMLELTNLLETSPRAARWQWLFLTHTQWHAVVFVLAYLCDFPGDGMSDRAWSIVQDVYERWTPKFSVRKGMLWKPLTRLMAKAQHMRDGTLPTSEIEHPANSPAASAESPNPNMLVPTISMELASTRARVSRPSLSKAENPQSSIDKGTKICEDDQVSKEPSAEEPWWNDWTSLTQEADIVHQDMDEFNLRNNVAIDTMDAMKGNMWGML